jgi:hypothetical protein
MAQAHFSDQRGVDYLAARGVGAAAGGEQQEGVLCVYGMLLLPGQGWGSMSNQNIVIMEGGILTSSTDALAGERPAGNGSGQWVRWRGGIPAN